MAKKGELTLKQQRFCEEYVVDFNGAQAAIRAGFSKKTAKQIACELLTKPDLIQCIASLVKVLADKSEVSAQFVLDGLKDHALESKAEVSIRAYELIGKHFKLFTDKTEVSLDPVTFNFIFDGKEKE